MHEAETIVAIASAPGRGDRVLLRVSGPAVDAVCERCLDGACLGRGVHECRVRAGGEWCPAIAIRGIEPRTYTGEGTLELLLPGNPHLVEVVLEGICGIDGVRMARAGEFSSRAFLNGRISLAEAEGVAALIAARSGDELESARRLESGEAGRTYEAWAEELATLLALVEAGIDFTEEEDVVAISPAGLQRRAGSLATSLRETAGAGVAARVESVAPLVVLVGSPNAGKSTLFNALLGRTRSVVSERAGATRDVLVEDVELGEGCAVRLADLPGIDDALAPIDERAQRRAHDVVGQADLVIVCDPTGSFSRAPRLAGDGRPVLRVRTKADLPVSRTGEDIAVCAIDGWHVEALRLTLLDRVRALSIGRGASLALVRHARAIGRARDVLDALVAGLDPSEPSLDELETVAEQLRTALGELEDVLGRISPDQIIGRVFSTFCVGK